MNDSPFLYSVGVLPVNFLNKQHIYVIESKQYSVTKSSNDLSGSRIRSRCKAWMIN